MALLLVSGVLPTLHIVRRGVDENIAFLLAGFNIILSEDRQEVVRIVVYYLWCVESESVLFILLILSPTQNLCPQIQAEFKHPSFIKFYKTPSPCISKLVYKCITIILTSVQISCCPSYYTFFNVVFV